MSQEDRDPSSLISIVLHGGGEPATDVAPTYFTMPSIRGRLSDREIADVVSFIRSSWGNKAPAVTPEQVARIRAAAEKGSVSFFWPSSSRRRVPGRLASENSRRISMTASGC